LVLGLSGAAVTSEHVSREVERAGSKHKQIVAFRVDAAALSAELEYFLSRSQWIDVSAVGMPTALGRLLEAVAQGSRSSQSSNPILGSREASNHGAVYRAVGAAAVAKRVVAAAVVVVVLAVGGALAVRFWPSKQGGPAPVVTAISDKSIAVLPFADLSEKHDQEYFADGVTEEVLDRLANVPGLRLIGRASSFQFRGKSADLASIGSSLGVSFLLEGSVRKDANRVRVAAQLVDARTGSQRWSDHFDSDLVDVLRVQDNIAAGLARALQIAVEVNAEPHGSVKSPEVLDAYLRGRQLSDRSTRDGCEAAVAQFQKALTIDPTFAPAAIGLMQTYNFIGESGWLPPQIAFERARKAAILAESLDPRNPTPHVSMAWIHIYYDWNWASAEHELERAFALGPRDSNGVMAASFLAEAAHSRWDDARQLGIEAVALDPLNPATHESLGYYIYLRSGRFAEAEDSFRRALQIAPGFSGGHYSLGLALLFQGHWEPALAEFRKETLDGGQLEGLAMVQFAAGRKSESDAQLAEAIRQNGKSGPYGIASAYAYRGDKDSAFAWLDNAYQARDPNLISIKGDPLQARIESDPRFKAFLKKMNLPE
jgi:TolB-like protein/tetratricopeptide (TPR) repeat protein